jgi:iron complex transport system substrate-binding protein
MDIASVAALVHASDMGQQVVAAMEQEVAMVRSHTAGVTRPRVFCEEWGKPLITSQPWVAELIEAAGGTFAGTPGARQSVENVRSLDPDILIAAWCGAGDRVPLEKIVRDRGWQEVSAVRAQRVYCIRDEYLNTPAPTLIAGLHALAAAIHPKIFPPTDGLRQIRDVSVESRIAKNAVV